MLTPSQEAASRRTFAIISHPDAGKTTLTERLLQLAGAVGQTGRVKARPGKRAATSDWMEIERARGISVSSTVLRFQRIGVTFNLLDTPGHHDFSEDTYRVLSAADAAVMLIDAGKGAEEQTLRLLEVARQRRLPIITFVNKIDRPGLPPLELLDDIEQATKMEPTPATWPLGPIGMIDGIVDRRSRAITLAKRTGAAGLVHALHGQPDSPGGLPSWPDAAEELALLEAVEAHVARASFLAGTTTPVFFGCALTGFGVDHLLDATVDLIPSPTARLDKRGHPRALDSGFSAFVFKVQANLDPRHRDRIAFLRVCSGRFQAGMRARNARTGRKLALNHAFELFARERVPLPDAYPGDIIGVAGATDLRIGDTLYDCDPVTFPRLPILVPQVFAQANNTDRNRHKQFQRGLRLLDEEGVVHVLHSPNHGPQNPVLAGAGPMQFDVAAHRLQSEFAARITLEPLPYRHGRGITADGEALLRAARGADVLTRRDGARIAVFLSDHHLREFTKSSPQVELATVL